jgi:hypothetical protein
VAPGGAQHGAETGAAGDVQDAQGTICGRKDGMHMGYQWKLICIHIYIVIIYYIIYIMYYR